MLQQRFELVARPAWLLRCAQSDWNLAQFDLSLSAGVRRSQRLRRTLRQWRSAPAWRPARWGLAALVGAQLLGLNAAAWHERSLLSAKQEAVQQTLQTSFPQVTLVLDAPVQMQRELARLQQASARHARLDGQLGQMQRMASAAEALRGQNTAQPPSRDEVLRTLEVATNGLGGTAQLSVLGDRATVTLRNTQPDALAQWLAQVRINARLIPLQSQLTREAGNSGWSGTVVLSGPSLGTGS